MRTPAPVPRRRDERGVAYFFVILFALLAIGLCLSSASAVGSLLRDRPRARFALEASWAADAGVEKARVALARDPAWKGGPVAFGRSSAEVSVRPVGGDPSLREVVSVGSVVGPGGVDAAARTRVAATLRLGPGLPVVVSWRGGR